MHVDTSMQSKNKNAVFMVKIQVPIGFGEEAPGSLALYFDHYYYYVMDIPTHKKFYLKFVLMKRASSETYVVT